MVRTKLSFKYSSARLQFQQWSHRLKLQLQEKMVWLRLQSPAIGKVLHSSCMNQGSGEYSGTRSDPARGKICWRLRVRPREKVHAPAPHP